MQNGVPKKKNLTKKKSNYFVDRKLLPRVSEYLDSKQSKAIDVDDIAIYLQKNFPEYGRKKRVILNQSVVKVLSTLSTKTKSSNINSIERRYLRKRQKSIGSNERQEEDFSPSDESEFSMTDEPLVAYQDTNFMNNSMQNLYKNVQQAPSANRSVLDDLQGIEESHQDIKTNESSDLREDGMLEWTIECTPTIINVKKEPLIVGENETSQTQHSKIDVPPVTANSGMSRKLIKNGLDIPLTKKPRVALPRISEDERSVSSRPSTPLNRSLSRSSKKKSVNTKDKTKKFEPTLSNTTFKDIGGYCSSIEEISKLLFHLKHPEVFKTLGIQPPRGFLLHGPPGCGKTLMANAIAGELKLPFLKVASTEVVSGISGETEQTIRSLFNEAVVAAPSILFIDEIDSITPKRENAGKEMERRIVTQILTCMDELAVRDAGVLVIGATNRADALDPALRRAGRFDREIAMGIPDRHARKQILHVLCRGMRLSEDFDYELIAIKTPGFVGADLQSLVREAAMCAVNSVFESLKELEKVSKNLFVDTPTTSTVKQDEIRENCKEPPRSWLSEKLPVTEEHLNSMCITVADFEQALPHVQPSSKREGFATVPDVTWQDIGALEDVREELSMAIMAPVQNPEEFESLGLTTPPGILLAGPPGCGKTLLAKAVANEAGINFISVKGPELLNMYVGESERAVRQVFDRARNSSPCVVFFDEIDALCPRRSQTGDSSASSRVVNQLLTEMDGLQARKQVFIMGATNRPDILDPAILRPGRLDKLLYVGFPDIADRVKILNAITKNGTKPQLSPEMSVNAIAADQRCEGYSGADLSALVREASVAALKECMAEKLSAGHHVIETQGSKGRTIIVKVDHFQVAFEKVKPSVSGKDRVWYQAMKERHSIRS